jgi:hypothetical protein
MTTRMVHVRTTATAVVSETWMLEVDDTTDINTLKWTGGWDDAIAQGKVRKVARVENDTTQHRNRKVVEVKQA